jgi:tetratricopeptide (TPR) repeat protein
MEQKNKITLRHLYRLIDEKLLNQDHDEAINYSQFLLKKYPKNFTVYQLLAKAYLDIKQFDLALVLFEKILEIDPDDFVSHIGVSIISESFGNLERALISMRRAYEIQPSNESLQNEVIRLVRQKDGFAPDKLRLTRGALIKMYTRSKLTDQAIAEAKLGIHESPERVDYKVHMAEMLHENGNTEEAVELSLQVLKEFPYCKSVLQILYNSISDSEDKTDSDLYKARLVELDPYFIFMKQETESVNDIPDIAIMIDLSSIPKKIIENIQNFIENSWENSQTESKQDLPDNTSDWQSIVDDAIANDGIGEPILDSSIEEVDLQNEDLIAGETQDEPKHSKREIFLKKISSSSEPLDRETYPDEEIPDWVLSYGALEKNLPEDLPIDHTDDQLPTPVQENGFAEDGMTDHAIPINPQASEDGFKTDSNEWEKIEESTWSVDENDELQPKLDETQRILVLQNDPNALLDQLETAFNENNTEFGIQCLEALTSKEFKLENVAELTEKFLLDHPTEIELWLLLVRVYRKLDLSDKALSALQNAQLNISI